MTIHYSTSGTGPNTACGRHLPFGSHTDHLDLVRCERCKVTGTYRAAVSARDMAAKAQDAMQTDKAQKIIFGLAKRLNDWANENGHCDMYDDAVSEANSYLRQFEIDWPERGEQFEIDVRTNTVTAENDEEAYAEIARNIRDYVRLR